MENAYFKNIKSQIIPYLKNAKREVSVAMAWFTSSELFDTLIDCLKRKVKVELVLLDDAINFMYYAPDFNIFIANGGILHIAKVENGFMHHKFCIVDDEVVITGSYNWTYYAETRNIENIVITDYKAAVSKYKEEFILLASQIIIAQNAPRLEWTEIEICQHINFDELNYEIENIAKAKNLPQKKVIKSTTTVTIDERPLNPISRFSIGVKVTTRGNNISMLPIIKKGQKLPYTSTPIPLYNYSDHRSNVMFTILCEDAGEKKLITERAITDITSNRTDWELNIKVQFTLVQSGDLFAEIRCAETGKVMSIKASDLNFVDYAD